MMPVRLVTERLVLMPLAAEHTDALARVNADPDVMRYIGNGEPRSTEQTGTAVDRAAADWERQGFGPFAIALGDGTFAGLAILAVPEFLPEVLPAVEVGWRISRSHWGKGYAPEAGRALVRFAFEDLGLDRLVSCIHRDNTASKRVAEKLGMDLERETIVPEFGVPCSVYELSNRREGTH